MKPVKKRIVIEESECSWNKFPKHFFTFFGRAYCATGIYKSRLLSCQKAKLPFSNRLTFFVAKMEGRKRHNAIHSTRPVYNLWNKKWDLFQRRLKGGQLCYQNEPTNLKNNKLGWLNWQHDGLWSLRSKFKDGLYCCLPGVL